MSESKGGAHKRTRSSSAGRDAEGDGASAAVCRAWTKKRPNAKANPRGRGDFTTLLECSSSHAGKNFVVNAFEEVACGGRMDLSALGRPDRRTSFRCYSTL